jgi:hypothetical protein
MSNNGAVALWEASTSVVVSDGVSDIKAILDCAKQLRGREKGQLAANMQAGHYEVAATFIWHRAMTLLKKQLSSLGNEFIGELLQRPDIDGNADISASISEIDAISLARDLGMITPTQAMRLIHSQDVISHFGGVDGDDQLSDDEYMTPEEAMSCLRVCIQGILGHDRISVAEDFASFRRNLEAKTFTQDSPEIIRLQQSPYFFVRTAISIIISVLKAEKGAAIEHASRNALLIIPMFWPSLKKPEKWQIGQAYAEQFSEGRRDSVKSLHSVLLAVQGFDYVPENLRSNTFTRAASSVIAAHQAMNNFYNEPAPMKELANLGTSIPSPALATCMTAVLCVKLGNLYGVSRAAQASADQLLSGISVERWKYYLDERLEFDRVILPKLNQDAPLANWVSLVGGQGLDPNDFESRNIKKIIAATNKGDKQQIKRLAVAMWQAAI